MLTSSSARGLHWSEVPNLQGGPKSKVPYPDLTYGLPIHNAKEMREAQLLHGSLESDGVANFSLTWHKELRAKGIITSPSACLSKDGQAGGSYLRLEHRICFPWAVVEVKRDEDPKNPNLRAATKMCYCQAANGAAAALALQQPLLKNLWGSAAHAYLYPVVAFTCIGLDIKTWLAYRRSENDAAFTVCRFPRHQLCTLANLPRIWSVSTKRTLLLSGDATRCTCLSKTCMPGY